jgi:hypothetical protein
VVGPRCLCGESGAWAGSPNTKDINGAKAAPARFGVRRGRFLTCGGVEKSPVPARADGVDRVLDLAGGDMPEEGSVGLGQLAGLAPLVENGGGVFRCGCVDELPEVFEHRCGVAGVAGCWGQCVGSAGQGEGVAPRVEHVEGRLGVAGGRSGVAVEKALEGFGLIDSGLLPTTADHESKEAPPCA